MSRCIYSAVICLGLGALSSVAQASPPCADCMPIDRAYAIAVDDDGNIWITQGLRNTVTKLGPDGMLLGTFPTCGDIGDSGIAVTPIDNDIWIVSTDFKELGAGDDDVTRLLDNGTFCERIIVNDVPTGVAVDTYGYVWVTLSGTDNVVKIEPGILCVDLNPGPCEDVQQDPDYSRIVNTIDLDEGYSAPEDAPNSFSLDAGPDNVTDMTGMATLLATRAASWNVIHDGGAGYGFHWTKLKWNTENCTAPAAPLPPGTELVVSVRAADTKMELVFANYVDVPNDVIFGGVLGRYIQVRVRLLGAPPPADLWVTPVLCNLEIVGDPGWPGDCNGNGVTDELEYDCNLNGVPDDCDITNNPSLDCNTNGVPDDCEIVVGTLGGPFYCTAFCDPDCNDNGIPDTCDIVYLPLLDCTSNGIPDICEPDCNGNGIADSCDIDSGYSTDCNGNGIPDEGAGCDNPPIGACCSVAGSCSDNITKPCCELSGGVHIGSVTTCSGRPCSGGACCASDGSCSIVTIASECVGTFLGLGASCVPNCCPQAPTGGDDCAYAAVHAITVPISGSPVTIDITGDNSAATGFDCSDLTPDPLWWEAFSIDSDALVTIDFTCTDAVFTTLYTVLYPQCPCGQVLRGDEDEASGSFTWTLVAGTYYYPIHSDGTAGAYQMHVSARQVPTLACCFGTVCDDSLTESECTFLGGLAFPTAPVCFPLEFCELGACCVSGGLCEDNSGVGISEFACTGAPNNGTYVPGLRCSSDPCAAPTSLCPLTNPGACFGGGGPFFFTSDAAVCHSMAADLVSFGTGQINQLCWRGMYQDFSQSQGDLTQAHFDRDPSILMDCSSTYIDDFEITVWDDLNGVPDQPSGPLLQESVAVTRTQIDLLDGMPVFEYTASLVGTVVMNNGICYWVEIQNDRGTKDDCYWLWQSSETILGTGSISRQKTGNTWDGSGITYPYDLSLCSGPSTILLPECGLQCLGCTGCDNSVETCDINGICQPAPGWLSPPMAGNSFDINDTVVACTQGVCTGGGGGLCERDLECPQGQTCTTACINESYCMPDKDGGYPGTCYVPKNRYVSIDPNPNNLHIVTARRISLDMNGNKEYDDGVDVVLGWVSDPMERILLGPEATPKLQSSIEAGPYYADWSLLDTVHIGDCEISPNHSYLIQNILPCDDVNDEANYSDALALRTVFKYGDVTGGIPVPPQDVVTLADAFDVVLGFQSTQTSSKVWLDLEPEVPDFSTINLADVSRAVEGFQTGGAYPFSDPLMCNGQGRLSSPKSEPLSLIGTEFFLAPQPVQMSDTPTVDVDVFINPVSDLATYEVALEVTVGVVELVDVFVDKTRGDFVFQGQVCIVGVDPEHSRLGAVRWEHSVDLTSPGYLGTFRYSIRQLDASDLMNVRIGLRGSDASYLLNSTVDTIPATTDHVTDLLTRLIQP